MIKNGAHLGDDTARAFSTGYEDGTANVWSQFDDTQPEYLVAYVRRNIYRQFVLSGKIDDLAPMDQDTPVTNSNGKEIRANLDYVPFDVRPAFLRTNLETGTLSTPWTLDMMTRAPGTLQREPVRRKRELYRTRNDGSFAEEEHILRNTLNNRLNLCGGCSSENCW